MNLFLLKDKKKTECCIFLAFNKLMPDTNTITNKNLGIFAKIVF